MSSVPLRFSPATAERVSGTRPGLLRNTRVTRASGLAHYWIQGILHSVAVMGSLPDNGTPSLGLAAVLTRFAVQDLVETLPLALLRRRPFMPAKVPVRPEHHYRVQLVFLPVFGLGEWCLMSGAAHASLRLTGQQSDVRRVMDVIGAGMLVPMPPLWLGDAALIAADRVKMPELGFINVPVQLWETALFGIGLDTVLDVPWRRAALAALAASAVYVVGASRLVR